jgi:hypothetical protein
MKILLKGSTFKSAGKVKEAKTTTLKTKTAGKMQTRPLPAVVQLLAEMCDSRRELL